MNEAEQQSGDDVLPCCGHSRRMHTPKCRHWTPGTRLEVPHDCACLGTSEMQKSAAETGADNLSLN